MCKYILDKNVPEPKHLPCILINEEVNIFSTNAAICYFLPPSLNIASKIYGWLEWEASILCPLLAQLGGSIKSDSIKNNIVKLLKVLDKEIKGDYLVEVHFF